MIGRSGGPRLHDPADQVRLEVEAMLARGAMRTIPLFVRGAESPTPEALPAPLQPLAFKHGVNIRRDPDFITTWIVCWRSSGRSRS
jgi:hypothetical protein